MKKILMTLAILSSYSAQAASNSSPKVKISFEKKASTAAVLKPFNFKDHQFNVSLSERLESSKDLSHNPKPSRIEEKALKLLSFGVEF